VLNVLVPEVVLQGPRIVTTLASLNPQAWRSMCGWIGNGILAASPTRWMRRWKPMGDWPAFWPGNEGTSACDGALGRSPRNLPLPPLSKR